MSQNVVLKLSGETLGSFGEGFETGKIRRVAEEIFGLSINRRQEKISVAVVIGGGNLARFTSLKPKLPGISDLTLHQVGMMATNMNAKLVSDFLSGSMNPGKTRVVSTIPVSGFVDSWDPVEAKRWLDAEPGRVLFVAGGTGFPGVATTDTAAMMVASQLGANLMLKGTKVDGVYDVDPLAEGRDIEPKAKMFKELKATDFLSRGLHSILDPVAVAMGRENHIPIRVFRFSPQARENISCLAAMEGSIGTLVNPL
ncbi:MAG: UMP kinase [Patescibacteria group bacterium]